MMFETTSSFPELFRDRLKCIYPEFWEECLQQMASAGGHFSFRINKLNKIPPDFSGGIQEFTLTPVSWRSDSFLLEGSSRNAFITAIQGRENCIYIQNLSSIFAAQALDPQPGEEVLDLAAAPGGKTLVLACAMQNRGRIAAVEMVKARFFRLKANLEQQGATIVQCYLKDGVRVGRQVPERFDRVLLDAPCSSESRFDPNQPSSWQFWSEKKIAEMQRKQKQLLFSAAAALKPGGRLLYSTCSYAPEENEVVVQRLLEAQPGQWRVIPVSPPFANYTGGLSSWQGQVFSAEMEHAIRILPAEGMAGFFLCLLEKTVQ